MPAAHEFEPVALIEDGGIAFDHAREQGVVRDELWVLGDIDLQHTEQAAPHPTERFELRLRKEGDGTGSLVRNDELVHFVASWLMDDFERIERWREPELLFVVEFDGYHVCLDLHPVVRDQLERGTPDSRDAERVRAREFDIDEGEAVRALAAFEVRDLFAWDKQCGKPRNAHGPPNG